MSTLELDSMYVEMKITHMEIWLSNENIKLITNKSDYI